MSKDNKDYYKFIEKPSFPIVGKIYTDSIDWIKSKVDPYSLGERYNQSNKTQIFSKKIRQPKKESFISLKKNNQK